MNSNNKEIKYKNILHKYNVQDRKSYEILKFYAEDLNEVDKKLFIELIIQEKGWELGTDICRLSRSRNLIQYFEIEFANIIQSWFDERLNHSDRIRIDTKFPNLPHKFIKEFIEIFVSVKNLGFTRRHLEIIEDFFRKSNRNYLKGFFEIIFRVIVHDFNVEETTTTFLYFTKKFVLNKYYNYSDFLCYFLLEFITSDKIFSINEEFTATINELLTLLPKFSDLEHNRVDLTSFLLIHLIRDNKTDFNESNLSDLINSHLNQIEFGQIDNLFLFQFLERFNFKFEKFKFDDDIDIFLTSLEDQLIKISDYRDSPDSYRRLASHYTKESDNYVELFIFYLSKINYDSKIYSYIERFILIVEQLRTIFQTVFLMKEYINFEIITGQIYKKTNSGFIVKIEENYFDRKLKDYQLEHLKIDENFVKTNSFAFIKEKSMFEINSLKGSLSTIPLNRSIDKLYMNDDYYNFFINDVNLSLSNRGFTATVSPHSDKFAADINNYGLKAIFCELELFLIDKAYELLGSQPNFYSNFFKNHKFNIRKRRIPMFDNNSYWNLLKNYKPILYKSIYQEHERKELLVKKVKSAIESKAIIDCKILTTTNGGFFVDLFNTKAFLPGSQLELKVIEDYNFYVGKTYAFQVIDFDQSSLSIIVSRRSILESIYDKKREELKNSLEIDQVYKGIVKNITSYGAFVDLGGVDGLIHLNDLSWKRIKHPSEIVDINDEVEVKILDFDDQRNHISLGIKQLIKSPWSETRVTNLNIGCILKGCISLISEYGIFVELFEGIEGLIYKADIPSWNNPQFLKNYNIGDIVTVKTKLINIDEKKIGLYIYNTSSDPWENKEILKLANSTINGIIVTINTHGIFVEISKGIVGLIHISDFSWNNDDKYLEQFVVGDNIKTTVKRIDLEKKRISLNYRTNSIEFWNYIKESYHQKTEFTGKIEHVRDRKVFVLLNENFRAHYFLRKNDEADILKPGDKCIYVINYFDISKKNIIVRPIKRIRLRKSRL